MKKKHLYFLLTVVAVLALIIAFIILPKDKSDVQIETEVEKGDFEIVVAVTGELEARNSVKIEAPSSELRELHLWNINITKLIPEGTVVDSGEVVATLDETEIQNEYKDILEEIERRRGDIERAQIDSSLDLQSQRDKIENIKFNMEEAEINLEQSKYESPSIIRKNKNDLEKYKRELEQAIENFKLIKRKAVVNINREIYDLNRTIREKDRIEATIKKLKISAPAPGMVIYKKNRDGTKLSEGQAISPWDPTVALLPDLSSFNSKTYINEIDISKVQAGQEVEIGIDAFPDKKFSGTVTKVANIGEQLPNTDAKVFEVLIQLEGTDPVLRPAMTTSNSILTQTFEEVLYVPLEAVHSSVDSLTFVYSKRKKKKLVLLGEANENDVVIEKGLDEGEIVLLSVPDDAENYEYENMELAEEIKKRFREKAKKEKEQRERKPEIQRGRVGRRPQGMRPDR